MVELSMDDQEAPLGDTAQEVGEAMQNEPVLEKPVGEGRRDFVVDLWPFACSIDYYKRLCVK
eukprot:11189366-Lingulodinium_polyedra.AAC.1